MIWMAAGYLVFGALIAAAMNSMFDLGGPIDPAASGSPSISKWLILPASALFWPLAILIPIFALISWANSGSH